MTQRKHPDIDIDVANRDDILKYLTYTSASKIENNVVTKHPVGIYLQKIPIDPLTGYSSIDYDEAEDRGYTKLDILNLNLYKEYTSNSQIDELLKKDPDWDLLRERAVVDCLFHLSGIFHIVEKIRPTSLEELAIVVAIKMPAKMYLLNHDMDHIKKNIWKKESGIYFKKSHSFAYATAILLQMNKLSEDLEIMKKKGM